MLQSGSIEVVVVPLSIPPPRNGRYKIIFAQITRYEEEKKNKNFPIEIFSIQHFYAISFLEFHEATRNGKQKGKRRNGKEKQKT